MSRYGTFWVDTASKEQPLFDLGLAKRILGFTDGMRGWLWLAVLSAPLVSLLQLARPYLLKLAVDHAITPADINQLWLYTSLFGAVLLLEMAGMYSQLMLLQWLGQRVLARMREALYRKVLKLGHRYFHKTPVGTTLTRLTNDLEAIQELFAAGIVTLATDILKLLGIIGVLFWLNWRLALIIFLTTPILYVVSNFFRKRLRIAYREVRLHTARLNSLVASTIDGIEDVQAQAIERDLTKQMATANDDYRQANLKSILNDSNLYAVVEMLSSLVIAGLIWFGGGQYVQSQISLGALVAFIEYTQMFFEPIRDLSAKYAVLQSAFASAEKIFALLDEPVDIVDPQHPSMPATQGSIAFKQVDFSYNADQNILKEITFTVPAKKFIAIVGPTGHGKSTVMRLLRRYYDPTAGTIELNEVKLDQFALADLRQRTLSVEQKNFLFSGSIRHNLKLNDDIADDILIAALNTVGFDEQQNNIPAFLDFVVEEGGRNFSLGQRQLLALARVLVRNPEVLLLDEATAHIDSSTEANIYRVLRAEHGQRTMIAIAHRLSTIREADEILVVQHGKIIERGNHTTLMQMGGTYARLITLHNLETEHEPKSA